jgi:hypothetical protein
MSIDLLSGCDTWTGCDTLTGLIFIFDFWFFVNKITEHPNKTITAMVNKLTTQIHIVVADEVKLVTLAAVGKTVAVETWVTVITTVAADEVAGGSRGAVKRRMEITGATAAVEIEVDEVVEVDEMTGADEIEVAKVEEVTAADEMEVTEAAEVEEVTLAGEMDMAKVVDEVVEKVVDEMEVEKAAGLGMEVDEVEATVEMKIDEVEATVEMAMGEGKPVEAGRGQGQSGRNSTLKIIKHKFRIF